MITVFTPLLLGDGGGLVSAQSSTSTRALILGGLLALYPLAQFFGAPVLGSLSDRFGRRPVLLISLIARAAFYALIALALHLHSLALLAAACLLAGLAEANIAIAQSAIADIAPVATRGRLFGYVYLSSSLAYVVGPLAGGKLADPGVVGWFGPATPFLAVAALLLATLGFAATAFRETHAPDPTAALGFGAATRSVGGAFARGRLRRQLRALPGDLRLLPRLPDVPGRPLRDGISRESEFIAWVAVPIVLANLFLVGWLSQRIDPRRLTIRCGAVLAVCLAAVIVPHPEGALWVTLFACSLALAICLPSMATIVSDAVGPAEQGRALGTNQSLQVGAEGLSGLAGGGLAAISTALPLPVMGALALLGSALLTRPAAIEAAAPAAASPAPE
jgi:DHA1 family tetracycline resistance protein-like MFS transporter